MLYLYLYDCVYVFAHIYSNVLELMEKPVDLDSGDFDVKLEVIALGSLLNSLYRKRYSLKISMKELCGEGQTEVICLSFHKIILWVFFGLDLKIFF